MLPPDGLLPRSKRPEHEPAAPALLDALLAQFKYADGEDARRHALDAAARIGCADELARLIRLRTGWLTIPGEPLMERRLVGEARNGAQVWERRKSLP